MTKKHDGQNTKNHDAQKARRGVARTHDCEGKKIARAMIIVQRLCLVCYERQTKDLILCQTCARSLVEHSNAAIIEWAARRARKYEKRRRDKKLP